MCAKVEENNMGSKGPLKRSESLRDLSRDHHHGLLLCWKIRTGLKKQIDPVRIKKYTDFFYDHELKPHFEIEEKYVFPLLGEDNELIQRAMSDHHILRNLFEEKKDILHSLIQIEKELEKHIRFEERELFKELQRVIPEQELLEIIKLHHKTHEDNWPDKFWE